MAETSDDRETKQAKRRTDWAEDRTLMSSERSFSSWMGTALGCVGVAIGLNAVFSEFALTWVPKFVSTLFLITALVLVYSAHQRACAVRKRLSENDAKPADTRTFTLVAALATAAVLATGLVLWLI